MINAREWPYVVQFAPPEPYNALVFCYYPRTGSLVVGNKLIEEAERWNSMFIFEEIHPGEACDLVIKHGFSESRIAFNAGTLQQNRNAAGNLLAWLRDNREKYSRECVFCAPVDPRIEWRVRQL